MESIFDTIRASYAKMGRGEKKVADCILRDAKCVVGLSISELAETCGCGDATVVRFARRLGLSGYQALKIRIAQEVQYNGMDFRTIEEDDSCYDIFLKRKDGIVSTLEETQKILSPRSLENAVNAILNAGHILLYGVGFSASIAVDMQHKLLYQGFSAAAYSDPHLQMLSASQAKSGDVVIGVSLSGSSVDIVEAMRAAQGRGAVTVAMTHFGISPIDEVSAIKLCTQSGETDHSNLWLCSRIAQLAIADALVSCLILRRGQIASEAIKRSETALECKLY